MTGLYGEYAEHWTCPRCGAENDREFCGQCRTQRPYKSARSAEAAAYAESRGDKPVRPPRSGGLTAGLLIVAAVLALAVGVPVIRNVVDSRQTDADRSKATKITRAVGQLPTGFRPVDTSTAARRVPAVVQTCVFGGAADDKTRATAAYASGNSSEVLVAAQFLDGEGRARDVAAGWGGDAYRACLGRQLASALSARPAGVAALPAPDVGEQVSATRVVLALSGGSQLVVDVVAVQSARAVVTLGFASSAPLPDALRAQVMESVSREL